MNRDPVDGCTLIAFHSSTHPLLARQRLSGLTVLRALPVWVFTPNCLPLVLLPHLELEFLSQMPILFLSV